MRERFSSRSSSRGTSTGATAANFELKASANNTPEMVRRQIQISGDALTADCTTPEIVRIRTTAASAGTACTVDNVTTTVASTTEERTESREDLVVLRRHGHIVESSCDVSQDLRTVSGAQSLTCPSTNPSNAGDYTQKIQKQMPNRQVSKSTIGGISIQTVFYVMCVIYKLLSNCRFVSRLESFEMKKID